MESKIHPVEHSYFEFKRAVAGLISRYPFVRLTYIGKSVAGRDIPALTIGSGKEYALFVSGDDPTCRMTSLLLLMFAEELCQTILVGKELCGIHIRKAMFGRGVILVPLLNPDGFEINRLGAAGCGYLGNKIAALCNYEFSKWRANLRGVELVRNLPLAFEERRAAEREKKISGPRYAGFSGYRAESEPETAAFTEFCKKTAIRHMVQLSSFGGTVCYSGGSSVPPRSAKMAEVLAAVTSFAVEPPMNKNRVSFGDWFTHQTGRPAIEVRVGDSTPPAVEELPLWYPRLKEMLTLSCLF